MTYNLQLKTHCGNQYFIFIFRICKMHFEKTFYHKSRSIGIKKI